MDSLRDPAENARGSDTCCAPESPCACKAENPERRSGPPLPDECLHWGSKAAAKTGATLVAALGVLCAYQFESHPSFVADTVLAATGGSVGYVAGWLLSWTLIETSLSVSLSLWALAAWLAYLVTRGFMR